MSHPLNMPLLENLINFDSQYRSLNVDQNYLANEQNLQAFGRNYIKLLAISGHRNSQNAEIAEMPQLYF